jgi:hypothetical protein
MITFFLKSRVIFISAFSFLCFDSFCQGQLFVFKSIKIFDKINVNKRIKSEVLFQGNDTSYSMLYYQKSNKLFLNTFNLKDDTQISESQVFFAKDKDLKERHFISYGINQSKLAIVTWTGLMLFTKSKKGYSKNTFIPLKVRPTKIFLTDSFIYNCHYYFSHPMQDTKICYINKFDFKGNLVATIEFRIPYPEYTVYAPFSPFSFSGNSIVVAIQTPYIFYEVNLNLKIINKVTQNSPGWISPPDSFKRAFHNGFFNNKMLDSLAYYGISRLECSNFINDSTLLIKRRERIIDKMNFLNYYFDIYKKNINGEWEFIKSVKEDSTPLQMDKKTDSTFCLIFSNNSYHFFHKKYLIKLELSAPISPLGLTLKEWMLEKETWLKKNDPVPVLIKYNINENY